MIAIRYILMVALCAVCVRGAGQEIRVVGFAEKQLMMTQEGYSALQESVSGLAKVFKDEEVMHFSIHLITRSSASELSENKFIGVNRALVLRDSIISVFTRTTEISVQPYHFYIQDLGPDQENRLVGVQISAVIRD